MLINLLTTTSGASDSQNGDGAQATNILGATSSGDEISGEDIAKFSKLFEGKLAEIRADGSVSNLAASGQTAESANKLDIPAPKILAALMQSLQFIVHEPDGQASAEAGAQGSAAGVLPQLSADQISAIAAAMGVTPQDLKQSMVENAQQILPTAELSQNPLLVELVAKLTELAEIGQNIQNQEVTLVSTTIIDGAGDVKGDDSNEWGLIPVVDSSDDSPIVLPELQVSQETIAFLSEFFGVPHKEIQSNVFRMKLVPLGKVAQMLEDFGSVRIYGLKDEIPDSATQLDSLKKPGLIGLLSLALDMPRDDVWRKIQDLIDGEGDLALDTVFSAIVPGLQYNNDVIGGSELSYLKPENSISAVGESVGTLSADYSGALDVAGGKSDISNILNNSAIGGLDGAPTKSQDAILQAGYDAAKINELSGRTALSSDKVSVPNPAVVAASPVVAQVVRPTVQNNGISLSKGSAQEGDLSKSNISFSEGANRSVDKTESNKTSDRVSPFVEAARVASSSRASTIAAKEGLDTQSLRDSKEVMMDRRAVSDSPSTLNLSASDSKLDFASRLNEKERFAARDNSQANSIRDQVAVQVKKAIANGDTRINVRLNPVELGRVDVRIEVNSDGRTTLAVSADNKETLSLLQRDSRALERAFSELGMQLSDSGMSFDLGGQSFGQQGEEDNDQRNQELGNPFGSLLGAEDEMIAEALLDSTDMNYTVGVDDGLNIKV